MDKLKRIAGVDVPIPELQIALHQPTLKEIALVGEENFFRVIQLFNSCDPERFKEIMTDGLEGQELAMQKHKIRTEYSNEWQIFCFQVSQSQLLEVSLKMFLMLLLPDIKNITFLQNPLIIQLTFNGEKQAVLLNERNFGIFKDTITFLFDTSSEDDKKEELNPIGEQAERIAAKMREAAEKRRKMNDTGNEEKEDSSALGTMASILATSDGLSINEVLELTFPQLIIQMNRTTLLKSYQTQITMGAFGGLKSEDIVQWQKTL